MTLLRAAAKNHARVTIVCDPCDYDRYNNVFQEWKNNGACNTTGLFFLFANFMYFFEYMTVMFPYSETISIWPCNGDMRGINHVQAYTLPVNNNRYDCTVL